jgi:Na+-transporting methylmalonyl-CoA/oxaloacetate decarboxylase gamma subunit
MASHRKQKGTVLVISLLILLVMTTLGVSAMLGSNLQERMVANQKQTIQASMAAESGALMAIRWLRAHPEVWGDTKAWKADGALPSRAPSAPNLGGGVVYWIESIRFEGNTATVVSRGGVLVADKIIEQSGVTAALQNEPDGTDLALGANEQAGNEEDKSDNARRPEGSVSAAVGSMVEFIGLNTQNASAGAKTEHDPVTIGDTVSHTDYVATPDDAPRTKKIKGRVIFWRQSAVVGR